MLIQYVKGRSPMLSACRCRCNTNCKLHSDEGDGCFSVAFEGCLSFVRRGCNYCNALQIVRFCRRLLLLFLRVGALACACTLFEAVFLPFARLLLLLQYFARRAHFRASCGLYCSRVCCSLFCAPSVRKFNEAEGQRMDGQQGDKPPASVVLL